MPKGHHLPAFHAPPTLNFGDFQANCTLTTLEIGENHIGNEGAAAIANSLKVNAVAAVGVGSFSGMARQCSEAFMLKSVIR